MQNKPNLTVVLPSYREAENLKLLLPRLSATLSKMERNAEILVVDTVQPLDETPEVCRMNGTKYMNRTSGNSFGAAVRMGIKEAQGIFILFMDADGSHPPEFIPKLYQHREDYDIVIASRYIDGGFTENSRLLILMSRAINIIYSLVLNLQCKDVSNSFKLYRASLLKKEEFYSNNFDIVEEILFKIKKKNHDLKILEVPFTFKKRMYGKTKRRLLLFAITYIFTLLKLRFRK
jgi:dolichol-phosphate mannosyltransferase